MTVDNGWYLFSRVTRVVESNVVAGYYMYFTARTPLEHSGVKPVEFYLRYSRRKTSRCTAVALAKSKAYSPSVEMNPE